ncbi:MAG: hypothetical protein GXO08_04440 [Aquificae bacterium]|nr:hypothetical protein [Aquificota bacterium]
MQELKELEEKRKNREISAREFYLGLLELLGHLKEKLVQENISEDQIRKQIPLLLTFIKAQIKNLENRGG